MTEIPPDADTVCSAVAPQMDTDPGLLSDYVEKQLLQANECAFHNQTILESEAGTSGLSPWQFWAGRQIGQLWDI